MFGYKCAECGEGTVRETTIPKYHTKVKGYPFVVDNAILGICDKCGAEHFAAIEAKRWERLFEQGLAENKLYLLPEDIANLRQWLGLSMEQFALLIGCTRQSLYNWEKTNRARPQSRTIDLMMKLVARSRTEGKVDVIDFLVEEAQKLGIVIKLNGTGSEEIPSLSEVLILEAKQIIEQSRAASQPEETLAYKTQSQLSEPITIIKTEDGKRIGKLTLDYATGNMVLELDQDVLDFSIYEAEVITITGENVKGVLEQVEKGKILLLKETEYRTKEIKEVHLIPKSG